MDTKISETKSNVESQNVELKYIPMNTIHL